MRWKCLMGGFVLMFLSSGIHAEDSVTEDERQLIRTYLGAAFEETLDAAPPLASVMPEEEGIPKFTVPFLQDQLEREQTRAIPIGPMPFLECVPSHAAPDLIACPFGYEYDREWGIAGLPGRAYFTTEGQFIEFRTDECANSRRARPDLPAIEDVARLEDDLLRRGEAYLDLLSFPPEIDLCQALNAAIGLELSVKEASGSGRENEASVSEHLLPRGAIEYTYRLRAPDIGLQVVAHCVLWGWKSKPVDPRQKHLRSAADWEMVSKEEGYVFKQKVWVILIRGTSSYVSIAPPGIKPGYHYQSTRFIVNATTGDLIHWDVITSY